MEQMKLTNEELKKLLSFIIPRVKESYEELSKVDINNITLTDLIHHKSQIPDTLYLSTAMGLLDALAENYFYADASKQQMEQIKERFGADNSLTTAIININTADIENRIENINSVLESRKYERINSHLLNSYYDEKIENKKENDD